jgi:hypothetical protein
MCSTRYFCPVLTEFGFYWPVFIKFPILKFHRNPSSMGRVHSCVQTDMAKVVDVTVRRSLSHKRHSTRCICNTKVTPIMPLWSIIILYSEKDTKHTNTFCGQAMRLWTPWAECWVHPEAVEKEKMSCPCLGMNPIASTFQYNLCLLLRFDSRSQWPRGLRFGCAATCLLGCLSLECRVLSGRGL